jgi:hypothetical protein
MFTDSDPELDNALALAKSDPQQAAKVLRIAADYLKKMKPLPSALALFLADAFERAMKRPTTSRGQELLVNLYLEVTHRRPKANFEWVGVDLEELIHAKVSKGDAIIQVGENYGITESTVKRMHKKYLELKASEEVADALVCETERRHYTQQSTAKR